MAAFASGQAEVNTVLRLTTYLPCWEFSAVVPQKRVYSVPDPDPEIKGGRSSRPLDKGGGVVWKNIFLRASVLSNNNWGAGPFSWIRHCYWSRHLVHQNKQTPSPKFCIGFVFHFSCVWQSSKEKLKTLERFRVKFTAKAKREIQVENVSKLNM